MLKDSKHLTEEEVRENLKGQLGDTNAVLACIKMELKENLKNYPFLISTKKLNLNEIKRMKIVNNVKITWKHLR